MNAAHSPTLTAISDMSHPSGTRATTPTTTLPTPSVQTFAKGLCVRRLATLTPNNRFTKQKARPHTTSCAMIAHGIAWCDTICEVT